MGFSLGGQLGIALTAKNQDTINALVVEGTFTSHKDVALLQAENDIRRFFANMLVTSGYTAKELIRSINLPELIIHSSEDKDIPFNMGVELYKNAQEPKAFWEIKGSHINGLFLYEKEYIRKVNEILNLQKE